MSQNVLPLTPTTTPVNTGLQGAVPEILGRLKGVIFAPKGATLSSFTTPQATIQAKYRLDSPQARYYPFGPMWEITWEVDEIRKISSDYGIEVPIGYGNYSMILHPSGSKGIDSNMLDIMQNYNGRAGEFDCFLVDENNILIGTNSSGNILAFSILSMFATARKFDGGEKEKPGLMITFSNPKQMNDGNLKTWALGFDPLDASLIQPMTSLALSQHTAPNVSRIVEIMVKVGSTNFADTSNASLLAVTGAWKAYDSVGAAITPSAASIVTVGGYNVYRVTFGATNYPSSSGTFYCKLHLPSVLAALGSPLTDYEGINTLTLTAA